MSDHHANTEPLSDEQLVAYLDGEMPSADARRLEARLADDGGLRSRLNALDRTWQLLDQLETDAAGRGFTRTTLEMVAAAEEAERSFTAAPRRRVRRAALAAALLLAAGMAGFLAVAAVRPDPNRRLLEDFPILENLERYRAVDGIDFLTALHRAGLFQEELPAVEEPPGEWVPVASPDAARERIAAMDRAKKEQLRRWREQFAALDADEQARLRRLYHDLAAAREPETLHAVALRYYEWLKALPPIARAELVELSPAERVERIENLLARQSRDRIRRLGAEEAQVLGAWLSEVTDQMIEALPESAQARIRQEADSQRRRGALLMFLQSSRSSDGVRRSIDQVLGEGDLAELRARLPESTRLDLERHAIPEQWRIVKGWIPQLVRHRFVRRGPRGLFSETDERTLVEFFEHELDDAEFDRLLALPAEEMQRELRRLYLQRSKGPPSWRPGTPGPRPRPGLRPSRRPPQEPPSGPGRSPPAPR